ncbi:V-type proton ATPase subunit H [Tanacetum coccineum]|uniref:V-type proton ATPase subunit H n=1 Tax=Tanacetum coccineum TaxID=301880 RepID=A0ABQ5CLN8_9ASTR
MPMDQAELNSDQVLRRDIQWETYMTTKLITGTSLQLLRRYDKKTEIERASLLENDGPSYIRVFISILRDIQKEDTVEYVLALIDEMLTADPKRAKLFHDKSLADEDIYEPFLRLLWKGSWFIQEKSSKILTLVVRRNHLRSSDVLKGLVEWLCIQLKKPSHPSRSIPASVTCLSTLLKEPIIRSSFVQADGVKLLVPLISPASTQQSIQLLYETCLCVWLLSYYEPAIEYLATSRALPRLLEVVKGSTKEKVVRLIVLTFKNLLVKGTFGAQMVDLGLPQIVQSLKAQAWSDEDLLDALNHLEEALKDNIKRLSSFDKYKQEVLLGHLDWSPMHKDPNFWRDNITNFEENDFQTLRVLLTILDTSSDPRALAVACYDLSQFIQYHPAGRVIVTDLKAKERVMKLMNHENAEVTKNALLCLYVRMDVATTTREMDQDLAITHGEEPYNRQSPRISGSMLGLLEEVVKVGQVMGYKMEGCLAQKAKKDWVKELCIKNKVNFLTVQETKMEKMDDLCVKQCWGNLAFDHNHSEAVGILGMTGKKMADCSLLVYAPQEGKEKQNLWDFLHYEIVKWNGDVIIMGDFNEEDACGFYLGVYKNASKMSKLDRFLVSESVLSDYPNINAITLERYLSDHRPILLKENCYDYGPTPFRFYHHWFEIDGFSAFVEKTWKDCPCVGNNAISILMNKLKFLKNHIRIWNKTNMGCRRNARILCKKKLETIDADIDNGQGNDELNKSRLEIIQQLQNLDNLDAMEMAQKAKIKWAVEGDENTGFFHEFFDHFANRFRKPGKSTASLLADFPNQISFEQRSYLESDVTNEEIKKAEVFEAVRGKKKHPNFIIQSDFEKAFMIRFVWDFLADVRVDSDRVSHAAAKLGCLLLKTPFVYLGSYVGGDMNRLQSWDDMVERVRRRLSTWKMKMLSIGGRLTLLKSFFNGHEISSRKPSWVQWKTVLAPKANGGLGISSLFALNRGLLFKWVWRFLAHDSTLWSRVVKAIHGDDGNIDGAPDKNDLGNGLMTKFWEEGWLDGYKLKDRFPRAYALDNCKSISVGHKLLHLNLTNSFRRSPRGGDGVEETQVEELKALIQNVELNQGKDKWKWSGNKSGEYSVSSARYLIDTKLLPKGNMVTRWIRYVPIKVNILAWKVMSNSLPTRFNISRRGIDIESLSCVNCETGIETVNHLFFSCDLAMRIFPIKC